MKPYMRYKRGVYISTNNVGVNMPQQAYINIYACDEIMNWIKGDYFFNDWR